MKIVSPRQGWLKILCSTPNSNFPVTANGESRYKSVARGHDPTLLVHWQHLNCWIKNIFPTPVSLWGFFKPCHKRKGIPAPAKSILLFCLFKVWCFFLLNRTFIYPATVPLTAHLLCLNKEQKEGCSYILLVSSKDATVWKDSGSIHSKILGSKFKSCNLYISRCFHSMALKA